MATITFSGIASGIDTGSLIDATVSAKRSARVEPLKQKISTYEEEDSALEELKDLLVDLKNVTSGFRSLNGNGVSMQATSNDESVLSATINGNVQSGTYDFTVEQLAKASSASLTSSGKTYNSRDALINEGITGTAEERTASFSFGKDSSGNPLEKVQIEITDTMTLSDFVNQFNSKSTYGTASLINKGTTNNPDYAVIIKSKNEGIEQGNLEIDMGSALTDTFDNKNIQNAQNAIVTTSGLQIERQSNKVTDIIPGMSLQLSQVGDATVTIDVDTDASIEKVQDFVDSFNKIVEYISKNDAVSKEDEEIVYGSLSKTSLDETILSSLRSAMGSITGSGKINILADLGITTAKDGTLNFDKETFKEAVAGNPDSVSKMLEDLGEKFAATGGTIDVYTRFNGLIDNSINSNKTEINSLDKRVNEFENNLTRLEQSLTKRFANLEKLMGELNQQMSSISTLLSNM